tara:strand:- start:53120 stop:53656 length:537 start_codon:yes stop_codon:yes gene_type:complete
MLVFSCQEKKNKSDASHNKTVDKNGRSEKYVVIDSPCELISIEEVKRMFAVEEYTIAMKDVVYTYPTCIFKWDDGKITTSVSFGGQEIKSTRPSEVLIVMIKKANAAMFKRSTSIYKEPQEISNIGTMAVWDARISQLTFLSNKYMFHVHVKVTPNATENKEKAIEVSEHIIKKMNKS